LVQVEASVESILVILILIILAPAAAAVASRRALLLLLLRRRWLLSSQRWGWVGGRLWRPMLGGSRDRPAPAPTSK
jgi:hypothetical protein